MFVFCRTALDAARRQLSQCALSARNLARALNSAELVVADMAQEFSWMF